MLGATEAQCEKVLLAMIRKDGEGTLLVPRSYNIYRNVVYIINLSIILFHFHSFRYKRSFATRVLLHQVVVRVSHLNKNKRKWKMLKVVV